MEEYKITRRLVACEVSLSLLLEIEGYLNDEIGEAGGSIRTLMSGTTGEKIFARLEDFDGIEIPDDVSRILLELEGDNLLNALSLSFSEDSSKNQLHISLTADNAQARVQEIVRHIEGKLEQHKTITRFIHSGFGYPLFILATVMPAGYFARGIVSAFSLLDAFFTVFATTIYTLIMMFLIRQFIPYCVFDSQRNSKVKKIVGYVLIGLVAISIFAGLVAVWQT